jgi:nucleotide-binding universal stress UspA family protein
MFKNVLVGVDGTPGGRDAIALAAHLLDARGKLTLAHVQCGELRMFEPAGGELQTALREQSEQLLRDEQSAAGVTSELAPLLSTTPGRGLHVRAERQQADLIVVGSCGRSLPGRVIVGDDTREALNGAPCAVAVAARGYARDPHPVGTIGVGYDGSPEAKAALTVAKALGGEIGAKVTALEVITIPPVVFTGLVPALVGESVDVLLEEATGRMQAMPDIDGRAVYGVPGEELSALGDELDLLVVGSRNFGPVRRRLVGSTVNYLERHARCSLLNIPRVGTKPSRALDATPSPAAAAV